MLGSELLGDPRNYFFAGLPIEGNTLCDERMIGVRFCMSNDNLMSCR